MRLLFLISIVLSSSFCVGQFSQKQLDSLEKSRDDAFEAFLFKKALPLSQKLASAYASQQPVDSCKLFAAWNKLAEIQRRMGKTKLALNTALKAQGKKTCTKEHIQTLSVLAYIYTDMSGEEQEKALHYYKKATQLTLKYYPSDYFMQYKLHNGIANYHFSNGSYRASFQSFKWALSALNSMKNPPFTSLATVWRGQATIYRRIGLYNEAEELYQQLFELLQSKLGSKHPRMMWVHSSLGELYNESGRYEKSLKAFNTSLTIAARTRGKQSRVYASLLNNSAYTLIHLGNYAQALANQKEAFAIYKKGLPPQHQKQINAKANLANCYTLSGNFEQAHELYNELLKTYKSLQTKNLINYNALLGNIGKLYLLEGNYSKSIEYSQQALKGVDQQIGNTNNNYFNAQQHLCLAYTAINSPKAIEAWIELMELFKLKREQFSYLSEQEKLLVFDRKLGTLERFAKFCVHHPNDSLLSLLQNNYIQSKQFALNSYVQLEHLIANSNNPKLLYDYQALLLEKKKLYKLLINPELKPQQEDCIKRINRYEQNLSRASRQIANTLERQEKTIEHKDIWATLDAKTAVIDFIHFRDFNQLKCTDTTWYYALVTTNQSSIPQYIKLGQQKELAQLLDATIEPNGNNYITAKNKNKALYKLIWQPLESTLKGIENIHIAPSGLLHQVAFESLAYKKNKYLVDKYQLHYHSHIQDILDEPKPSLKKKSIVLFGGANFDLDSTQLAKLSDSINYQNTSIPIAQLNRGNHRDLHFSTLSGSLKEVKNIYQLFKQQASWEQTLYTGNLALEDNLPNQAPTILHVATHGFFFAPPQTTKSNLSSLRQQIAYAQNPLMRSGLALTGANYSWKGGQPIPGLQDGILTAYEAMFLPLDSTQLVVLSACETGVGDVNNLEGSMGLQRALKLAGAQQLLISLWKVDDEATQLLMTKFYSYYLAGENAQQALQKAKQWLKKQKAYRNPYFWAAFVLVS